MPCTVVVGGQFGSEGKGKVVTLTASLIDEPWVVRCGGPNSGHTTNVHGQEVVLRQLPAAAGHPAAVLMLAAGCAVNEEIVLRELDLCQLPRERVVVDPRGVLVTKEDLDAEQEIAESIGSTASGTGAALVRRMLRGKDTRLVAHSRLLSDRVRIEPVAPLLHQHLDQGGDVIVEGTQGFGLSLLHGAHYPHVTARDTTASGFAMEVGLSPRQIDDIVLVVRTFPIRVGGRSGPLENELSWDEIQRISGAPNVFPELTSVTRRVRRVGRFNLEAVTMACRYNRPTAIAVMGLDRLDYANHQLPTASELTANALEFVRKIQSKTGVRVRVVGTGCGTFDAIYLPSQECVENRCL